jgi:hypothetical protein
MPAVTHVHILHIILKPHNSKEIPSQTGREGKESSITGE